MENIEALSPARVKTISSKLITAVLAGIATVAGLAANIDTITGLFTPSVEGHWKLTTIARRASLPRYVNLPLSYNIELTQNGRSVSGDGYKFLENGKEVPPGQQQPIRMTGQISGNKLILEYTLEPGANKAARETMGSLNVRIVRSGVFSLNAVKLDGTFSAQAADSSGEAIAVPLKR